MSEGWDRVTDRLAGSGVSWSALVLDEHPERALLSESPGRILKSASVGKLLLLAEASAQIGRGELSAGEMLLRDPELKVADSGIWQHLDVAALTVRDVARLVGLASDNWATNVLLQRIGGIERVTSAMAVLDVKDVRLHDRVRDVRTADHAATLSEGSAAGYVSLIRALWSGEFMNAAVSARVIEWLRDGLDLSMVASALGLDPLAHSQPDRGITLVNKTGTDAGVRADVGVVSSDGRAVFYAVLANWPCIEGSDPVRDEVLSIMRNIGQCIRCVLRKRQ